MNSWWTEKEIKNRMNPLFYVKKEGRLAKSFPQKIIISPSHV